jgi:SAM-dependent methyltransferase
MDTAGAQAPQDDDALAEEGGWVGTWHYGLVARWWAETNLAEPGEVAYYAGAIRRHGQPALDVGCGAGRLLLPLLDEGIDIDGTDISSDMIDQVRAVAAAQGHSPTLVVSPADELEMERRYGTILLCGVLGLAATRAQDQEALRRIHGHLRPGGVALVEHWLPYADEDEQSWARWLPGHREGIPRDWPPEGERRRLRDGDEIELLTRLVRFEPLAQRRILEMRARLWHEGVMVREETARLSENPYFAQELCQMLVAAGFRDVSMERPYDGRAATDDDATIIMVARA